MIRRRLGFGALLVVLFVAGWVFGWSRATARDRYEKLDLFVDALSKVESYYVDPVDPQKLVTGAINGMMKRLDPFSNYLDAKSFDELTVQTQGQFGGLGRRSARRPHRGDRGQDDAWHRHRRGGLQAARPRGHQGHDPGAGRGRE